MADMIAGQDKTATKKGGNKAGKMNAAEGKKQNPDQVTTNVTEKTLWNLAIHRQNPRTGAYEGSKVLVFVERKGESLFQVIGCYESAERSFCPHKVHRQMAIARCSNISLTGVNQSSTIAVQTV